MRILYLFFPLFFLPVFLLAQSNTEELKAKLEEASNADQVEILVELTIAYYNTNNLDEGIETGEKALKSHKKNPLKPERLASLYNVLGASYFYKKKYRKSLSLYEKELDIKKTFDSGNDLAKAYYNLALLYKKSGKTKKAVDAAEESLRIASSVSEKGLAKGAHELLYGWYEELGDATKALYHIKKYFELRGAKIRTSSDELTILREEVKAEQRKREKVEAIKDSLAEETETLARTAEKLEVVAVVNEAKAKDLKKKVKEHEEAIDTLSEQKEQAVLELEVEKDLGELNQKMHEAELKAQKLMKQRMGGLLFLAGLIALFLWRSYRIKQKANEELALKNDEIQKQKNKIEKSHDHITKSINYASRIQQAMLHGETYLGKSKYEFFILNRPRDVVSGDFYWIHEVKGKLVLIAADCTGHGVPGAFMSMLGISFLNQIVLEKQILDPAEILEELRVKVKKAMQQDNEEETAKDGMDMAICILDMNTNKALFGGAYNPMYFVRDGKLISIDATRNPVGLHVKEKAFETKEIVFQDNDQIYLFSDGYPDQLGGEKIERMKSKNFKSLLEKYAHLPMDVQQKKLESYFDEWRGDYKQIDDVLLLGLKIS